MSEQERKIRRGVIWLLLGVGLLVLWVAVQIFEPESEDDRPETVSPLRATTAQANMNMLQTATENVRQETLTAMPGTATAAQVTQRVAESQASRTTIALTRDPSLRVDARHGSSRNRYDVHNTKLVLAGSVS